MKQRPAVEFVARCAGEAGMRHLIEEAGMALRAHGFAFCAGGARAGIGAGRGPAGAGRDDMMQNGNGAAKSWQFI